MRNKRCWLPLVMVAAAGVGGAWGRAGMADKPGSTTDFVKAEAFLLTDKQGRVRGVWSALADGSVGLVFRDETMAPRMRLGIRPDGTPVVELYDAKGAVRAKLVVTDTAGPCLSLHDEKGNDRAVLGCAALQAERSGAIKKRPASSLVLADEYGRVVFEAP